MMNTIRSIFAFDTSIDAEQFAANCREWGVNMAILHPGYFDDLKMTNALQRNGVDLWLNIPVFYDPGFLEVNPEYYSITSNGRQAIHDWCHFVCPNRSEYIDRLLNEKRPLAARLQPAMMSLDFIRHYVFWELVAASPDSKIWIKTVPWKTSDLDGAIINSVGQDIPSLSALVDGIAPMAFTHILRQTPEWKDAVLRDVKTITGKPVISYVQVEKAYRTEEIPLQQFEDELKAGLEGDYAGISIFCYEQLVQSPEKIDILKTFLREGR
jgi:hypothetical protein